MQYNVINLILIEDFYFKEHPIFLLGEGPEGESKSVHLLTLAFMDRMHLWTEISDPTPSCIGDKYVTNTTISFLKVAQC